MEQSTNKQEVKKDEGFDKSLIFKFLLFNTPWIVCGIVAIVFIIFSFLSICAPLGALVFIVARFSKIKRNKQIIEEPKKKKKVRDWLSEHIAKFKNRDYGKEIQQNK